MRHTVPTLLALMITSACATPGDIELVHTDLSSLQQELDTLRADLQTLQAEQLQQAQSEALALQAAQDLLGARIDETDATLDSLTAEAIGEEASSLQNRLKMLEQTTATSVQLDAVSTALRDEIATHTSASDITHATLLQKIVTETKARTSADALHIDAQTSLGARITALDDKVDTAVDDLNDDIDDRVALIRTSTTITIPTDAKDLPAALAQLQGKRIVPGANVKIILKSGTYPMTAPIVVDHPDGHAISIQSKSGDPTDVTFSFIGTAGMSVPEGRAIGLLKGVTIAGSGSGSGVVHGLEVRSNGTISVQDVVIKDFKHDCVHVENGGVLLSTTDGLEVSSCGEDGIDARWGGVIRARGFISDKASSDGLRLIGGALGDMKNAQVSDAGSDGASVQSGSILFAPGMDASDNGNMGVRVEESSWATLDDAICENNGNDGIYAEKFSTIRAYNSTSQSNGHGGWVSKTYSAIDARSSQTTGNTTVDYSVGLGASIFRD